MTAVTEIDGELIEILDVEKILDEISPVNTDVSADVVASSEEHHTRGSIVMVADDSSVARKQVQKALNAIGVECIMAKDGRDALNMLKDMAKKGPITDQIRVLISDIEMPEMDGYTLTAEIRANPELRGLHVILHTSLSGVFNHAMVQKVGADNFIAKFHPDELAKAVQDAM